jgi:hypothetical protein
MLNEVKHLINNQRAALLYSEILPCGQDDIDFPCFASSGNVMLHFVQRLIDDRRAALLHDEIIPFGQDDIVPFVWRRTALLPIRRAARPYFADRGAPEREASEQAPVARQDRLGTGRRISHAVVRLVEDHAANPS